MRTYQWLKCRILAEACVIALLFVGCNSAEPAAPEPPGEPALGLRVEPRSDTLATGLAGSRLASVPVVRVTLDGNPAPGREVQFILSGGGSITFLSQRTDTAGLASPGTWTLGTAIGPERLVARVGGAADLVFTALVTAGPPATMEIVAGNHQSAAVRAPLPAPLRVKLADQYGNPAAGATVSYTVVAGSGTVLDARATAAQVTQQVLRPTGGDLPRLDRRIHPELTHVAGVARRLALRGRLRDVDGDGAAAAP